MRSQKISIVTPSFNQADYIPDNIQSVNGQSHDRVEHLILDAGSDDGTKEIIEDYADGADHDVWWRSEPDDGQSAAINEGFDRASGSIVGWLNSDDVYFDTTTLSRVENWFDRTGADVIYGDLAYVDSRSRVTEIDVRPEFDRKKLAYRIVIGQPATFFRREVVESEQLDIGLNYCMDYEFWIRLSRNYDIRHVHDILAGFRRHEAQKTDDMSPVNAEVETMLDRYRDELPEPQGVLLNNASTELQRIVQGGQETVSLHRNEPELAFDGELAPLSQMLFNLGPGLEDIQKALRRWRR
ncbi:MULTISPECIES: glycosyltransferase family 2 protein [unclassified Halorubrum]|uniref:glycosyltransferase family 2 protein n=1 Tax=unclassified Halorubrum TaxID=2642239 RepID=UPI0010F9BDD2|nr:MULTISPECIES: glycosyltransferase family 2 protein [unclassified Halorubrum]TKX46003.1 glycosyltransferase [Halorubrum sp. ARQ200]TKX50174.1 glycosyltransferase [Halorubrum sp. ASP121]